MACYGTATRMSSMLCIAVMVSLGHWAAKDPGHSFHSRSVCWQAPASHTRNELIIFEDTTAGDHKFDAFAQMSCQITTAQLDFATLKREDRMQFSSEQYGPGGDAGGFVARGGEDASREIDWELEVCVRRFTSAITTSLVLVAAASKAVLSATQTSAWRILPNDAIQLGYTTLAHCKRRTLGVIRLDIEGVPQGVSVVETDAIGGGTVRSMMNEGSGYDPSETSSSAGGPGEHYCVATSAFDILVSANETGTMP
ncbi:hypothetical protein K437DRAFT_265348 [Tilletiaria anomala UBC 951]|uniref:Uncharacterized protein n=1 Tax=Tilletiaria anomala (strain ATCC 24038 / CBS 436.72 / UBC 951) TaxID=1037660 RepID=A0A066V3G6_TILAU|nr:uncharacterized protein K437DRAFT_265348 [Tilletiaria anomala UBC 951]KDN36252.1 hypothetical protein K437DRAFT_265348 [Tilletiaria anomala UBC 951]